MNINEKLVKYNFSSRKGSIIKYIVIHDTGNTSNGADANAHYNYFNGGDRQSSAHYFVDDKQVLRIIKDNDKAWHCGDGNGKYGITNENSIGIEMCINKDGNFDLTYKNTVQLVKHLMATYNIHIDNVVRHYDASRKICPHIWQKNNWDKWHMFKEDLVNKDQVDYKPLITRLYASLFDRNPDDDGLEYWDSKLNSGLTVGDMLAEMSKTDEFKTKYVC